MWIDSAAAAETIASVEDNKLRSVLEALRTDGFAILPGLLTGEQCDNARSAFSRFCEEDPQESAGHTRKSGYHSRLYNLHIASQDVRDIALNPFLLSVLDRAFPARCALNSTIYFEEGSQQEVHRDTPFFTSKPFPGEFVGVWFALEDVREGSGPLLYVPGGHHLQVDKNPSREAGGSNLEMFQHYCGQVQRAVQENGLETKTLYLKKGDAAIWHADLPHGGSAISAGITRHSLVAHYLPEGAYVQDIPYFFDLEGERKIMEFVGTDADRLMRWAEKPTFAG